MSDGTEADRAINTLRAHDVSVKKMVEAFERGVQLEINIYDRETSTKEYLILQKPPASVINAFDHIASVKRERLVEEAVIESQKLKEHAETLQQEIRELQQQYESHQS